MFNLWFNGDSPPPSCILGLEKCRYCASVCVLLRRQPGSKTARDRFRRTIQWGHLEVVKYFTTELECDPMEKDKHDWTPLHLACSNGHLNRCPVHHQEKHCNPSYMRRFTMLKVISTSPSTYLFRVEHCNPSCEDIIGRTALHITCEKGQVLVGQQECS